MLINPDLVIYLALKLQMRRIHHRSKSGRYTAPKDHAAGCGNHQTLLYLMNTSFWNIPKGHLFRWPIFLKALFQYRDHRVFPGCIVARNDVFTGLLDQMQVKRQVVNARYCEAEYL